jgi:hypothetical protein
LLAGLVMSDLRPHPAATRSASLAAVVFAAILPACNPTTCERAAEVDPMLALGTGEDDFAPLEDGDEAPLSHGAQGGRHVWIALQGAGVNPGLRTLLGDDTDAPIIDLTFTGVEDGLVRGAYQGNWTALQGDADTSVVTGLQLVIDWMEETEEAQDFVIAARLEDVCGTIVETERVVRLP